jgi:hypothetical protein
MSKFFAVVRKKEKGDFVIAKSKNNRLLVLRTKAEKVADKEYVVDSFFVWTENWDFSVGLNAFKKLSPTKRYKLLEVFKKSYIVVRDYRGTLIPLGIYFEKQIAEKGKAKKEQQKGELF